MTVVSERSFTTTVRIEAPSMPAADEAFKEVAKRLEAVVPRRVAGLQVLSTSVTPVR